MEQMEGYVEFHTRIITVSLQLESGEKDKKSTQLPYHACNADDYELGFANEVLEAVYDTAWQRYLCFDDPSPITFKANTSRRVKKMLQIELVRC